MIRFFCIALALCSVATAGEKPSKSVRLDRRVERLEKRLAALKKQRKMRGDPSYGLRSDEIGRIYEQLFPRDIIPAGD